MCHAGGRECVVPEVVGKSPEVAVVGSAAIRWDLLLSLPEFCRSASVGSWRMQEYSGVVGREEIPKPNLLRRWSLSEIVMPPKSSPNLVVGSCWRTSRSCCFKSPHCSCSPKWVRKNGGGENKGEER